MKKLLAGLILCFLVLGFVGCGNASIEAEPRSASYIIVKLPNDEIVEGYGRFIIGSASYITVELNGAVYKTSSVNVCVIDAP